MMAGVFVCPICATFEASSLSYLLSHLRLVHSNDPRFKVTCGLDGCAYTACSFSALYSHVYRKHQSSGAILSRQQNTPMVEQDRISPAFQPPESMLSDSDTDLQSIYGMCFNLYNVM
jgi:hypothetical protein